MKSEIRKGVSGRQFAARVFSFVLLCSFCLSAAAQSSAELYNQANKFYSSKQFHEASGDYEQLLSQGYKSAEIYYNLGNCYYKMDSIGKCILNYERALKLSPKDEDILHNLKLARLKPIDNIQPVPQLAIISWWNDFVSFNSSKGWGIFALIAVWLFLIVFAISFFSIKRRIFNTLALLFLFLSFISLALAAHQRQQEGKSDEAIVIVSSSYVKSAPDAGASDLFMIHEGTRLQILDQVGEWHKIRLADGKVGWMPKEGFEKI